jgi:hypothetical protein
MGYDTGNNVTGMGASGVKVFKILTFGPIRK